MNYEELGFRCGIEIHQQLNTATKLFCDCPVDLEDENPDTRAERFLKAVAGETGEKDIAARMEEARDRKFIYNYYTRNNCLVELDEEPPHPLNPEALEAALTFARIVDAEVPNEIQVMRKMVVDGSNTSGFQRTAMVGLDGELKTETGKVSIEDIELEEESAGINSREDDTAVYDLSRLGVPLIEVGTDASIENPEHARDVAKKLGMLLRSTGKARRGLGTIRQDVNVSIEEGARVEIKGFQDVENVDRLIELEVERQKNLVELGEELGEGEVVADNVTHVFEDTENEIVSTVIENDGAVYAVKIPSLAGKMKQRISGERYVAKELVDYARSRGLKGMIHTDEDIESYQLEDEFDQLCDVFDTDEDDVVAILAGPKEKAREAAKAVKGRAEMLLIGDIPEETRNAEQDFTTSFSRPLPGSARMYPETDIPPIRIEEGKIGEIDRDLPDTLEEREERYAEEIGEELASQVLRSTNLSLFEKFMDSADTRLVANVFTNIYSRLESDGVAVGQLDEEDYRILFDALEERKIEKGDIEEVMKAMTGSNPGEAVEKVIESKSGEDEIRRVVEEVLDEKAEMVEKQGMHAQGALMGLVMERVEADGSTVSEILREELGKRA